MVIVLTYHKLKTNRKMYAPVWIISLKNSRLFDFVALSYQLLSIIYAKPILALLEKKKIANLTKSGNV